MHIQDIQLTNSQATGRLGIDTVFGTHDAPPGLPYTAALHLGSSRYARADAATPGILQVTVTNLTGARHPYHLHGFSMLPVSITKSASPSFTWSYNEYRDNIDVPAGSMLTFKIRVDDRPLVDGVTTKDRPTPTGSVTFMVDGVAAGSPVKLDKRGQASWKTAILGAGAHRIQAAYSPGKKCCFWASIFRSSIYRASTSPNLLHTVGTTPNPDHTM